MSNWDSSQSPLLDLVRRDDYQMPLFFYYDLKVEFEAKWEWAASRMKLLSSQANTTLYERVQRASASAEIEPLKLELSNCHIDEPGSIDGAGHVRRTYTRFIPYVGDPILWQLNPGVSNDFPDGEVFRGYLIQRAFASAPLEAKDQLDRQLARTLELIALQTRRIAQFNGDLAGKLFHWFRGFSGGAAMRELSAARDCTLSYGKRSTRADDLVAIQRGRDWWC